MEQALIAVFCGLILVFCGYKLGYNKTVNHYMRGVEDGFNKLENEKYIAWIYKNEHKDKIYLKIECYEDDKGEIQVRLI